MTESEINGFEWVDAASEWQEALSDPAYPAAAAANSDGEVSVSDIEDAIDYVRAELAAGRTVRSWRGPIDTKHMRLVEVDN